MAYAAQGDAEAMIQELQETLRLDPRHVEAHLGPGIGYLEQGGMEAAVERFCTVVRLDPHPARAYGALATLYFQ
jgi:Tfp pilus assembly protein PilF